MVTKKEDKKIYIIANRKGGAGKSTLASHLIPEYIIRKGKQEKVKLFEFDEYSETSADYLFNSQFVESQVIKEEDIERKIFNIVFKANKEDVVIDVGAGSLVTKIVSIAKKSLNLDKLVFVIPYSDDGASALMKTITLIQDSVSNPKILVALNRIPNATFKIADSKKAAINLFGSEDYRIKPHSLLSVLGSYIRASIPYNHYVFAFAKAEASSLVDLRKKYLALDGMDDDELMKFWESEGECEGDEITEEEFVENKVLRLRRQEASIFLDDCEEFYSELKKVEDSEK